ncbi:alpha/beta fold hydrolase [Halioglobus maricola]|uniref:Alpha/beta fold hydrolase n=1 Tax=Halioglobus maricola TaxID=2601894 RepID=A0A5P9NPL4_9GAMM|nr:alpha/beta fold hydrolase [Halioglobus maricola]QFU76838.1 alpha/beta fold hydrolase [Halioglobus maricola]
MRTEFQVGAVHGYEYATAGDAPYSLLIAHGIGGHGGTYDVFCEPLSARGVHVVSMDLPGHGLARCRDGERGNFRFSDWLEDIDVAAQAMVEKFGKPVYVLGSSQGSAAAFHSLAFSDAVTGAVCMNIILTEVEQKEGDPQFENFSMMRSKDMIEYAENVGDSERVDLSTAIDWNKNYSADDPDILAKKQEDDLRTWSYGIASMMSYANYQAQIPAAENAKPVLLSYGSEDPFTSSRYMEACFKAIGGPKEMAVIDGGSHQLMLYHTDEYIEIIDSWIRSQEA